MAHRLPDERRIISRANAVRFLTGHMMIDPKILASIRSHRDEALARAVKHDKLAAQARQDAADYEAAERVFAKMTHGGEAMSSLETVVAPLILKTEAQAIRRKPENVPPIPDIILEGLKKAEDEGKPGLNPQAMLIYVKEHYWPSAGSSDIGSTMWRMWKDGRLAKPDEASSLYVIARNREDAA
jgi:hypothetical protein